MMRIAALGQAALISLCHYSLKSSVPRQARALSVTSTFVDQRSFSTRNRGTGIRSSSLTASAASARPRWVNNCRKDLMTRLQSTTAKEDVDLDMDPSSIPDDGDKVIVDGELVSLYTDDTSSSSLAVVRLKDDAILETAPKMFGAVPKKDLSKKKKVQGDDYSGRSVVFTTTDGSVKKGTIVAIRPPIAFVLCELDGASDKDLIAKTSVLNKRTQITISDDLFGTTIDYAGNLVTIDEDGSTSVTALDVDPVVSSSKVPNSRAIFSPIPLVSEIALINTPMLTGISMVDSLTPIGKGQNMLFIQDEDTCTRNMAIDAIRTQLALKEGAKCIYACAAKDKEERKLIVETLKRAGVLDRIILVTNSDGEKDSAPTTAESVAVSATACAIGEFFARTQGSDCFIVHDNIDHKKVFWDWTTRALLDLYGEEAVVKQDIEGGASSEMRAFYSGLVQRSGNFNAKYGGGSVTLALLTSLPPETAPLVNGEGEEKIYTLADFDKCSDKIKARVQILVKSNIPITPTTLKKISIPVPDDTTDTYTKRRLALQHVDDLISMSDGQIWLNSKFSSIGFSPPLDPQQSITRVGIGADTKSRADAPALRLLATGLRFELTQAAALEDVRDKAALKQLKRRDAILAAMYQESGDIRSLAQECVALLSAKMGFLDDKERKVVGELWKHVESQAGDVVLEINDTLDLSDDGREKLESLIRDYFAK